MRIVFFGLPLAALSLLYDGHEIVVAVLSPLAAPGRRRLRRVIGDDRVMGADEDDVAAWVDDALSGADLLVSWYWTRRLPWRWLDAARVGAIGAHPSLLPRHRGPNPFFWAIDSGDAETGVTIHRLTAEYDRGDVLLQESLPIGDRNAWQLARALDRPSLRLLRRVVQAFEDGDPPAGAPQDESLATWAPEPDDEHRRVEWTWPTARLLRRVRALAPEPGLALDVAGVELLVTEAVPARTVPDGLEPGHSDVVGECVVIGTGRGAIELRRATIEREGRVETIGREAIAELVAAALTRG